MKCLNRKIHGFTLLELMITLVILGILGAIAIPSYVNYTRRAYFTEIVNDTLPYKVAVAECYKKKSTFKGCNGGSSNIPANITAVTGNLASLTVADGVITATPVPSNGILVTDTYVLTPSAVNHSVTWAASGGAVTDGYAQ